ncbi:MAG TPA: antirestriction protein ArdA, partial [Actinomycetota bacterium]|nr:antirestriction protein ArdA [Actinomycetota bacterium]
NGSEILRADPYAAGHEELWVFDHQGYRGFLSGECSPSEAQTLAEWLDQLDESPYPLDAIAAYRDHIGHEYADRDREAFLDDFAEAYAGEHDSAADFAENYAEETGALEGAPDRWPFSCIDWSHAADELETWTADAGGGCVYVFWQR